MAETVRAFIAIELNDQVKQAIREFQDQLKPLGCDVSWVKPENAHLTLKFLGDVKTKMIPVLTETLANVCRQQRLIETVLTEPGGFPDARHPRVLWVGLRDDDGKIAQLAESLETALGNIGFKKEKRDFQAHITIGRIRSPRKLDALSGAIENYNLPFRLMEHIDHITLYKSVLTSSGPIYTALSTFMFQ